MRNVRRWLFSGDAPDGIADVVSHEKITWLVNDDTDRPALGVALGVEESAQDFHRRAGRTAGPKRHEDHPITILRLAVP